MKDRAKYMDDIFKDRDKKIFLTLFLAVILGSILRFYGLEIQSLWNDELVSTVFSKTNDIKTMFVKNLRPDVHPPGHYIVLYFIQKYLGDSEFLLRFPSAIAGVFVILVIYFLGARIYSREEGLIASFLTAVLWCPIHYSQEVRSYSMLLLFTALATYLWIIIIDNLRNDIKSTHYLILGYIASAIISSYLHYYGLYLILLHGFGSLIYFLKRRKAFIFVFLIYLFILIAYLPWAPIFLEHINNPRLGWIPRPKITAFGYFLGFLYNKSMILLIIAVSLYGYLISRYIFQLLKERNKYKFTDIVWSPDFLVIMWLIVPFTGVFIKSLFSRPVLIWRALIISLPAAYLLFARAITLLPFRPKKKIIITSLIISIFIFDLVFGMKYYSIPIKDQWRQGINYIVEESDFSGKPLIIGYAHSRKYFDYYFMRFKSEKRIDHIFGKKKDIQKLYNVIRFENPEYIWYIYAFIKPDPEFIDYLLENLTIIKHKKFSVNYSAARVSGDKRVEVWLFKKK